jgi:2-methylcitrate dehydratase PrpD
VLVETHSLGAPLSRTTWDSRLGALFSIPFVVAATLVYGHVRPETSDVASRDDPRITSLAGRVRVKVAEDLDARLPDERGARITVRAGGREHFRQVPNPIGDAAHHPFGEADVLALLSDWLDDDALVTDIHEAAAGLPGAVDVRPLLRRLAR